MAYGQTVNINGKAINIRAMSLDDNARFIAQLGESKGVLEGIVKNYKMRGLMDVMEKDAEAQFAMMMDFLVAAPEQVKRLLAIILKCPEEEVGQATPNEIFDACMVAWEVNNLGQLLGKVKKVISLATSPKKTPEK